MANSFFRFKQFTIHQEQTAMKVTTDSCLFGAWVASEIQSIPAASTVLDIGAGTGLLSMMIAQKNNLEIDAVEIDEKAAAQARANITNCIWKERINVLESDVLQLMADKQYSIIVTNPPFYENELNSPDRRRNIAHHSENLNLKQLIAVIKNRLLPNGEFFILLPVKRENDFENLCSDFGLYINMKLIIKQSVNHTPFRLMMKGSLLTSTVLESAIDIKDEQNNYTTAFIELLKDYYLNL